MLFSRLIDKQGINLEAARSDAAYLGERVQSDVVRLTPIIEEELRKKIKQLQSAKKRMIFERLGTRNFEHPSFGDIDFGDETSIYKFLAQENIKCALICDPFQPLEQLAMLCDIINSEYDSNKLFPHISVFRGYQEAQDRKDSREDLITYFKINLLTTPQDDQEKQIVIDKLREIIVKQ